MQIDGHHTGTYVAARLAGFKHDEADTIAYAAQYVDDATNDGLIQFSGSEYLYARIASAHKMIDYHNLVEVKNHLAWLPFHFLPGNGGLPATKEPDNGETGKLTCHSDSPVARDMLRAALQDKKSNRALHRLGIAMHVYADTFSHAGFIGAQHSGNRAKNVTSGDSDLDKAIKAVSWKELILSFLKKVPAGLQFLGMAFRVMVTERKSFGMFLTDFFKKEPLGHAAADTFPDQPFLVWSYTNHSGEHISRNNPEIYYQAFDSMVRAMQAWRKGDSTMDLSRYNGIKKGDAKILKKLIHENTNPDGEERRKVWLKTVEQGAFSFGPATLTYQAKGAKSWKAQALGTMKLKDSGLERYPYSPRFLTSDWKLFHDALQAHRNDVVHNILPRYGICAA